MLNLSSHVLENYSIWSSISKWVTGMDEQNTI